MRALDAADLDPLDRRLPVVEDQELLELPPARLGEDPGRYPLLGHRQHGGSGAKRSPDLALRSGERAALRDEVGAVEAGGEVAIGEREPPRRPEPLESLVDDRGVCANAPAALLVDLADEPVGDQVRVRRDPEAMDVGVVGGVHDHREVGSEVILKPGGELPAAGSAGKQDDLPVGSISHR